MLDDATSFFLFHMNNAKNQRSCKSVPMRYAICYAHDVRKSSFGMESKKRTILGAVSVEPRRGVIGTAMIGQTYYQNLIVIERGQSAATEAKKHFDQNSFEAVSKGCSRSINKNCAKTSNSILSTPVSNPASRSPYITCWNFFAI